MDDHAETTRTLYRRFSGVIYELCFRILRDRQEAEDAMQETFIGVHRSLSGFRQGSSHLTWMYQIATNVCFKMIRRNRRKMTIPLDVDAESSGPSSHPLNGMHARHVLAALDQELDTRGRQIFVYYYLSGMNQDQIAQSLGITRRSVVKRLAKMRRLASMFNEEDPADE